MLQDPAGALVLLEDATMSGLNDYRLLSAGAEVDDGFMTWKKKLTPMGALYEEDQEGMPRCQLFDTMDGRVNDADLPDPSNWGNNTAMKRG